MAGPEDQAYRERLLSDGQGDPLPEIIEQVTLEIRNAIRSNRDNQLHSDATFLPAGAIYHAVAIVRFRLLSRFAVSEADQPGDARKTEYREAITWLDLVRKGTERVEPPYGEADAQAPSPSPRLSGRPRRFTRNTQDGI